MLICNALVPRMRAFSYFVMNGVVVRLSLGIFLSLCDNFWPVARAAALGSPETTTLASSLSSSSSSGTSSSKISSGSTSSKAASSWYLEHKNFYVSEDSEPERQVDKLSQLTRHLLPYHHRRRSRTFFYAFPKIKLRGQDVEI